MSDDPNQDGKKKCRDLSAGPPEPTLPQPPACEPDNCCCPKPPPQDSNCLQKLIDEQAQKAVAGTSAADFKKELDDLLAKANAAKQKYTKDKYKEFKTRWSDLDKSIVDLIAKTKCALPCWRCLVECELCTLITAVGNLDFRLNGDGALTTDVHSLYDLQAWKTRNRDMRKAVVDRIGAVLKAWVDPATTLDKILSDNATLVGNMAKLLATDPATVLYTLVMKLIPLQLMIAPKGAVSNIDAEFRALCPCDTGAPEPCCGPDSGVLSLRDQLVGPQPYIADPDQLFAIICCLAKERYRPAKDQLAAAEASLAQTTSEIARGVSDLAAKKASLAADFKAAVGSTIDCDKYHGTNGGGCQKCPPNPNPNPNPNPA
ncbi:MAG TPA: hypothetical protein VG889_05675 [Rhizomicrobium sp.]|nr:hypothetical protein [Rhizomicrobium sp.]